MRIGTAKDVAEMLAISVDKVYDMAQARELPSKKIGSQLRFDLDAVEAWFRGEDAA